MCPSQTGLLKLSEFNVDHVVANALPLLASGGMVSTAHSVNCHQTIQLFVLIQINRNMMLIWMIYKYYLPMSVFDYNNVNC
jgi:hypothetical protein